MTDKILVSMICSIKTHMQIKDRPRRNPFASSYKSSVPPALAHISRVPYRFGFSVALRMRFTKDWDIRNVRAMAAGLTPARNDARMRFAVPSGNSLIPLVFVLRNAADWRCDDVPVATAVAVSFLV